MYSALASDTAPQHGPSTARMAFPSGWKAIVFTVLQTVTRRRLMRAGVVWSAPGRYFALILLSDAIRPSILQIQRHFNLIIPFMANLEDLAAFNTDGASELWCTRL